MGTKHSTPRHSTASRNSHTNSSNQSTGESCASPRADKPSEVSLSIGPTESSVKAAKEQNHRHPTHTHKESPLDHKYGRVTQALQNLWRSHVLNDHKEIPFTRILLKFPQAAKAFNSVRSTFKALDKEGRGFIVYDDLPAVFKELGVSFTDDEINQVYEESDLKEDGKINFKELLVSLSIGFLLHRIASLEKNRFSVFYASRGRSNSISSNASVGSNNVGGSDDDELRGAFQLAVDAFLWFDADGSGYINRSQRHVRAAGDLDGQAFTNKKAENRSGCYKDSGEDSTNWSIWDRRFAEMDWNHNGTIHFNEFLMAFESWVGVDDDDDEDEGDETRYETDKETSTAVDSSAQ